MEAVKASAEHDELNAFAHADVTSVVLAPPGFDYTANLGRVICVFTLHNWARNGHLRTCEMRLRSLEITGRNGRKTGNFGKSDFSELRCSRESRETGKSGTGRETGRDGRGLQKPQLP